MSRILAIDFGLKRIGLALSDELKLIARPYRALSNDENTVNEIGDIVRKENVDEIVIGLPLNLDGTEGEIAKKAREFGEKLKKSLENVKVVFYDERFTSKQAERRFMEKTGRIPVDEKSKREVDKIAAAYLLQSYIDSLLSQR